MNKTKVKVLGFEPPTLWLQTRRPATQPSLPNYCVGAPNNIYKTK